MKQIAIVLASTLALSIFLPVYAQQDQLENQQDRSIASMIYLWAPSKMIEGKEYDALVVMKQTSKQNSVALITTSDPSMLGVPASANIMPYTNHGLFKVQTLKQGTAKIFVSIQGEVASISVRVYSSNQEPSMLKIILPANSTKADRMLGYVFVLGSNGSPAPVQDDVRVHLSTSGMIQVPRSVEVKQHGYYAKFIVDAKGSGTIFASAKELKMAEAQIVKEKQTVSVRVAVAPNIALENSQTFFYVWLEKDDRPYMPPYAADVFVSSSEPSIAFFTRGALAPDFRDASTSTLMQDGIAKGFLFTGGRGNVTITASVKGFGSAQTNLVVGPVVLETFTTASGNQTESSKESKLQELAKRSPNTVLSWAYPSITTGKAFGVAALYYANLTKTTNVTVGPNATLITTTHEVNTIVPVPAGGRTITVTSDGLEHQSMYAFKEGMVKTHAAEFEVKGNSEGKYSLAVSGPGLERSQADLTVMQAYRESYRLGIQPLPARADMDQDLAIISIIDSSNSLVNAEEAFAGTVNLEVFATHADTPDHLSISNLNAAALKGKLTGESVLTVSATGIGASSIEVKPAGVVASLEFDLPEFVHMNEKIPYAVHAVDAFGIPLERIQATGLSSSQGIRTDGDYFVADTEGIGRITVLAAVGAEQKELEVFANNMTITVSPDKRNLNLGQSVKVRVLSDVEGIDISIDSPLSFNKTEDLTYTLTPDQEGEFDAVFTATKDGYRSVTESVRFLVQKFVNLMISAVSADGSKISLTANLHKGNSSETVTTPYTEEIRPQQISISFPDVYKIADREYVLRKVFASRMEFPHGNVTILLNDDVDIKALYELMLRVNVEGAEGSDFYPYGSTATLRAIEKDRIPLLVREVFDHWEGLPYNTKDVTLTVIEDINASAVYRDDYTGLMAVVASAATFIIYKMRAKKGTSVTWFIIKAKDRISYLLQRSRKK